MKIYTKSGDGGDTGLYGGPRVRKDAPRIEAYGTVDELNAVIGLARTATPAEDTDILLAQVQNDLFNLGAELAATDPARLGDTRLNLSHIELLEAGIDRHEATLPPLKQFILPGGTRLAADLHLARTVCRRAERRLVTLADLESVSPVLLVYLNRLSDLLFVLARSANQHSGVADILWRKESPHSASGDDAAPRSGKS